MTRASAVVQKSIEPRRDTVTEETIQRDRRHYCHVEGCTHKGGFKKPSGLARHQRRHDPLALWHCGCCQNRGDVYNSPRKDHLTQHLLQKHNVKSPHKCTANHHRNCNRLLFSNQSCVEEHMCQEHGLQGGVSTRRLISG